MTAIGWIQIVVFFLVVLALTKPLGAYMFRAIEGEPLLPRVERAIFRLCGVDPGAVGQVHGRRRSGRRGTAHRNLAASR